MSSKLKGVVSAVGQGAKGLGSAVGQGAKGLGSAAVQGMSAIKNTASSINQATSRALEKATKIEGDNFLNGDKYIINFVPKDDITIEGKIRSICYVAKDDGSLGFAYACYLKGIFVNLNVDGELSSDMNAIKTKKPIILELFSDNRNQMFKGLICISIKYEDFNTHYELLTRHLKVNKDMENRGLVLGGTRSRRKQRKTRKK